MANTTMFFFSSFLFKLNQFMQTAAKAKMDEENKGDGGDDDVENEELDEKAKKKAEKAAKKARKAEKEAKKLAKEKNGEGDDGEDKQDDEKGDVGEDEVFYGAPDDHAWTDSSHAIKESEKNNDDGPDTSVSYTLAHHTSRKCLTQLNLQLTIIMHFSLYS